MSIPVQELRIGNFAVVNEKWPNPKYIVKVKSICEGGIEVRGSANDCEGIYASIEECELTPIPLTPEILEKAGGTRLTKAGYDIYFSIPLPSGGPEAELYIAMNGGNIWLQGNRVPIPGAPNMRNSLIFEMHVQYLHQLQNLLYTLMGQELKLNFGDMKPT